VHKEVQVQEVTKEQLDLKVPRELQDQLVNKEIKVEVELKDHKVQR
jgi:hypothetical protein